MTDDRSRIPFRSRSSARRVEALGHARIIATSKTFGWSGLHVEIGENRGWKVEDLVIEGHYLGINTDSEPLIWRARQGAGWVTVRTEPRHLWVQPAHTPFSFEVQQIARWGGLVIDPQRMKALVGADAAVETAIGLFDPVLVPIVEAVLEEVKRGGSSGRLFADAALLAISTQLLRLFGDASVAPKGGLTGRKLRMVGDFVEAHLAEDISLDDLAGLAGLSAFHFSRAFKQSTGLTPHRFVVERRLERGKRALVDTGDPIASIAQACGFADQAHFARAFRQRFGVSPSEMRAGQSR
jgi:AraC family transcriptional regulator